MRSSPHRSPTAGRSADSHVRFVSPSATNRRAETGAPEAKASDIQSLVGRPSAVVYAMGASTGGTEALRRVLTALPADAPAVVVVQHMPPNFTRKFAERLNQLCAATVSEAQTGDVLLHGRVFVAPGDRHLRVVRSAGRYVVELDDGPAVNRHRPSVDVLFSSVAEAVGADATGVLLTGMGDDGARGLCQMRAAGGWTIAQDEATSVVYGMPGEAVRLGGAVQILPLGVIGDVLVRRGAMVRAPDLLNSRRAR